MGSEFDGFFPHHHPSLVQDHIEEIEEFAKVYPSPSHPDHESHSSARQSLHTEVLDPLHVLLAIALELPEDYLTNIHKYEQKSEVPF